MNGIEEILGYAYMPLFINPTNGGQALDSDKIYVLNAGHHQLPIFYDAFPYLQVPLFTDVFPWSTRRAPCASL